MACPGLALMVVRTASRLGAAAGRARGASYPGQGGVVGVKVLHQDREEDSEGVGDAWGGNSAWLVGEVWLFC